MQNKLLDGRVKFSGSDSKKYVKPREAMRNYTPEEVAGFLCGSARTVYDLCHASRLAGRDKQMDERWLDFVSKRAYTLAEIAQRLTCARKTIYNLRQSGAFEFTVLRSDRRVPDWSLCRDFCGKTFQSAW